MKMFSDFKKLPKRMGNCVLKSYHVTERGNLRKIRDFETDKQIKSALSGVKCGVETPAKFPEHTSMYPIGDFKQTSDSCEKLAEIESKENFENNSETSENDTEDNSETTSVPSGNNTEPAWKDTEVNSETSENNTEIYFEDFTERPGNDTENNSDPSGYTTEIYFENNSTSGNNTERSGNNTDNNYHNSEIDY